MSHPNLAVVYVDNRRSLIGQFVFVHDELPGEYFSFTATSTTNMENGGAFGVDRLTGSFA